MNSEPANAAPGAQTAVMAWPLTAFSAPAADAEWDALLSDIIQPGHLRIGPRGPRPGAANTARLMGGGVMADLHMPAMEVIHRPEHMVRSREREILVHLVREGSGELEQSGSRLHFQAGDMTFRDARRPSRICFFSASVRLIALRLPVSRWQGYATPASHGPAIATGQHALTQAINGFVRQMENGLPDCSRTAIGALEQALVLMLGAAHQQFHGNGASSPSARPQTLRWRQIHDYIDAHFYDAALAPADCARALRISERYLYRVLADNGEQFSRILQNKRLDASAERLRNPRFSRYLIASIAYQCGFNDPAHFSRAFCKRFGVAPRVWRAGCASCYPAE